MNKYEFKRTFDFIDGPKKTVTFEVEAEDIYEILSSFEDFLRGCGFRFDKTIDLVELEDEE